MQTLCFIFLLLKDVEWEGDFGDSDSWSSVLPYGSWTEMSRVCKEVSCNLLPSLCSDISASHGVFCPACWHVSLSWSTLVISAACYGLGLRCFVKMDGGQGKLAWIMALFPLGKKMSHPCVVISLVLWNTALVSPQWEQHDIKRKYKPSSLFICEIASQVKWQLPVWMWTTCNTMQAVQEPQQRVSVRLVILFSFLIRWFLKPVAC